MIPLPLSRTKTFKHCPIELGYDDLSTETIDSKRKYVTPVGKTYPSITSILGYFTKASIIAWRNRVGAEEANRVSRHACGRGNAVHSIAERYINNEEDFMKGENLPHIVQLARAVKGVIDERLDSVVLQECPLYSDQLKAAGRVDLIGNFDDELSIVDFKTSKRIKSRDEITDYFIQACAYSCMFEERTGTPIEQLVIIMAVDGSNTPIVFKERTTDWLEPMVKKITSYHAQNPS